MGQAAGKTVGLTGSYREPGIPNVSDMTARLVHLDALRGAALFGILVVNIAFFASGYPFHLVDDPAFDGPVDHAVDWVIRLLFEMKAYLLFSFLFGYSFTLQLDAAARTGADFRARTVRRAAGLFVLGGLHAVLLFHGDILSTYAVLSLVLLAAHRIRPRTALIVAGVIVGVIAFAIGAAAVAGAGLSDPGAHAAGAASTAALANGDLIGEHLRSLPAMFGALAVQGPLALSAFFVGLAAGRRKLFADPPAHLLRRAQLIGFPVGLAGAVVFAAGGGTANLGGLAVSIATAPFLVAAYVGTVLRVYPRFVGVLAPAGRMALTNYLGQSLLAVLVFTGAGLGLAGEAGPAAVFLVAVAIFALQVWFSAWWLARHRYGPVEWLLRAVTNAELPGRVPG
jgi:uncharacterized protein